MCFSFFNIDIEIHIRRYVPDKTSFPTIQTNPTMYMFLLNDKLGL